LHRAEVAEGGVVVVRRFDDEPTLAARALQIWQILIGKSHNRQSVTYKILSKLLGYGGSGVLSRQLGHIMFFCAQNDLPPLTSIVVNEKTGLPGEGIELKGDLNVVREEVYNYDWYGLCPPSVKDLEDAWAKAKAKGWKI
jgi:hypothetical protein